MNKKLIPIALLALAAVGYFVYRALHKPEFRYAGTIEATRIELPARVPTVIASVDVEEGQKIKRGQKLIGLACEDVRIAARLAAESYRRAVKLRRGGTMTQEAFDKIESAKQDADTRLSWCEIRSPVDGTVLTRYLEPGEWASPGVRLVSVADLSRVWAYLYVPQSVMSRLKVGAAVQGVIPELDARSFPGVIRKISDEAEFTPKNVQTQAERTRLVFGIKVAFDNPDATLKPGMTIEVPLPE